jgi:phage I-like protein
MTTDAINAPAAAAPTGLDLRAAPGVPAAQAQVPEWVMLARTGAWLGHPRTQQVISTAHLRSALDYFTRHYAANGADLVVDYHHASVVAPQQGMLAPAAGWIRQMELRNGDAELWGRVLWTSEAHSAIAARRFRYLSPALGFGVPDRLTGQPVPMVIHSVALTNTPFLTELESLNQAAACAAVRPDTRSPGGGSRNMSLLEAIAQALDEQPEQTASRLGLTCPDDDRQVAQAIAVNATKAQEAEARERSLRELVTNAAGIPPAAADTAIRAALIRLRAPEAGLSAVRTKLGLKDDAPEPEILNAIGTLQDAHRRDAAEELVDAAVRAGKVPPAHRDFYLREAAADPEAARAVLNSLPVLTAPQHKPQHPCLRELTAGEESVCRQLGLTSATFLRVADSDSERPIHSL